MYLRLPPPLSSDYRGCLVRVDPRRVRGIRRWRQHRRPGRYRYTVTEQEFGTQIRERPRLWAPPDRNKMIGENK